MTDVEYTECDICGERIGYNTHLKFRRWFLGGVWARLYNWEIVDLSPVTSGWRKTRVDICEPCWSEVCDVVEARQFEARQLDDNE